MIIMLELGVYMANQIPGLSSAFLQIQQKIHRYPLPTDRPQIHRHQPLIDERQIQRYPQLTDRSQIHRHPPPTDITQIQRHPQPTDKSQIF